MGWCLVDSACAHLTYSLHYFQNIKLKQYVAFVVRIYIQTVQKVLNQAYVSFCLILSHSNCTVSLNCMTDSSSMLHRRHWHECAIAERTIDAIVRARRKRKYNGNTMNEWILFSKGHNLGTQALPVITYHSCSFVYDICCIKQVRYTYQKRNIYAEHIFCMNQYIIRLYILTFFHTSLIMD